MHESSATVEPRGPIGFFALKHDDTFLVANALGDILGEGDGLFRDDTRVLSCWQLTIGGVPPSLLGAAVSGDNVLFRANVTNRPLPQLGGRGTPRGVIHLDRARLLWQERFYERLIFTNYEPQELTAPLGLRFAADFADIFEVRGMTRKVRGRVLEPRITSRSVLLRYEGLDRVLRGCGIAFSDPPANVSAEGATWQLALPARASREIYVEVGPDADESPGKERFRAAAACARTSMRRRRRRGASATSSRRLFDVWVEKSRADIALLTTTLPSGPYPYAGIPWFSAPFGRDGIITALQTLWLEPGLARGVLAFLAEHQAHATSAFDDAAPGKIMHESRRGEMAATQEVPFRAYYGSVDATPLFVLLAGAYAERTADLAFIDSIAPALERAMAWIGGAGDSNQDGLLDYASALASGLANQGWKDSFDSVFHSDGRFPKGPIALVEVQGYVYAARRAMAELAAHRGDHDEARRWKELAESLRHVVEKSFWMDEESFYGIAVDGERRLCRVRASNAGQLLYSGLPSAARAKRVIEQLLSARFDSGWGLRTLGTDQPRYNPMSYHNGSVWPHDTAICAAGMAYYGHRTAAAHVLNESFAAALHFGLRLPELFCGFARAPGDPPVGYPVACLPQAWSSGAVFMMLQASLGVRIDGWRNEIHVEHPALPPGVEQLVVHGLAVGEAKVDLLFQLSGDRVAVSASGTNMDAVRVIVNV
jgi:glycogen debranching enzyme